MNSEPFHVMSQEWRYFSRQKALVHTLHLGQLPESRSGDSVFINVAPPTGTGQIGSKFNVPPLTIPTIPPFQGGSWKDSINNIPPMWVQSVDSFASPLSGTYGFTGSYGNFVSIRTIGVYELANTGGVFMLQGAVLAGQNNNAEMNPCRIRLFTTTQQGVVGATLQDSQSLVQMKGSPSSNWNNNMYVEESIGGDPLRSSIIVDGLPFGTYLGMYVDWATVDAKTNSYSSDEILALRLGPG